ncbi:MAG: FkbM family methyltransferase [Betaproteobacteria bacterium]
MSILAKIAAYATTHNCADFLTETLGPHAEPVRRGDRPFVLFGAGSAGRRLLPLFLAHGATPTFFCDNDPRKIGDRLDGITIITVADVRCNLPDAIVVITVGQGEENVRQQFISTGFLSENIRTVCAGPLNFYTHINQWYWSEADLAKHANDLAKTYHLLADNSSRRLFLQRIALLSGGAHYTAYCAHIKEHSYVGLHPCPSVRGGPENHYYFNNDVVRLSNKETIVDCGAFDGDTLEQFLLASQHFPNATYTAHCLEPDPVNFSKLAENIPANDNVHLYKIGAWSGKATLDFEDSTATSVNQPSSAKIGCQGTGIKIEVDALDTLLAGEQVTFIKMDIEGAEKEALQGATELIAKCRPTLAISIYHLRDDIFQIPLLIDKTCAGYRFHLRLFSQNFTETVLFAIPG